MTIKVGDRVHHKSRDSDSWSGKVLLIQPEGDLGDRLALVEVDGPYNPTWASWRLVPVRTLDTKPPSCDSHYLIGGWSGPLVRCELPKGHLLKHMGPVPPSGTLYW